MEPPILSIGPALWFSRSHCREPVPHPLLIQAFHRLPAFRETLERLPEREESLALTQLAGSSPALLLSALHTARPERIWLVIAAGPEAAEQAAADLEAILGEDQVFLYPQRESLPYDEGEPHLEIGGFAGGGAGSAAFGRTAVLIAPARAVQELAPAIRALDDLRLTLRVGQEIRPAELGKRFEEMGLEHVPLVEEVGQFALRGGILDVFAFGHPDPVRIEFWGDTVESIRGFEVLSQLSVGSLEEVQLLPHRSPARRSIFGGRIAPLPTPHRPTPWTSGAPCWTISRRTPFWSICNPRRAKRNGSTPGRKSPGFGRRSRSRAPGWSSPNGSCSPSMRSGSGTARFPQLRINPEPPAQAASLAFRIAPPEPIERNMQRLAELLRGSAQRGERTLILCDNEGQIERLQELLEEFGSAGEVTLSLGSLAGGFVLSEATPPLRVLTDHEIFRRTRRLRRRRRFRGGAALESFAALQAGDYVVHMDHGVGRFRGMERTIVGAEEFETLVLEYANGEVLRVPVHRVDLIERWVGETDDSTPPRVHRIGGKEWHRTRRRTQRAIEEMTAELLQLYAAREAAAGHAFPPDTRWQREMESGFLFDDTPDQRQATEDVKHDMESVRPMDRLLCGDVGYGKTEIAIRAAFKAVQDGKQVAVLVPTTILAQQHLQTFGERLAGFPVNIEALSRFRTAKEQAETLRRLAAGELDIIIGTHRLLSPDVEFRALGLIIVDEEQRFGVKTQGATETAANLVDVLTLTAPRSRALSTFRCWASGT